MQIALYCAEYRDAANARTVVAEVTWLSADPLTYRLTLNPRISANEIGRAFWQSTEPRGLTGYRALRRKLIRKAKALDYVLTSERETDYAPTA